MGTAVALLTARVWVLCGGDGAVSTGTGLLSAGVGVRRGVVGSLLCVMGLVLGQVQSWFYLHQQVARSFLKIVFLLPQIFPSPLQLKWLINKKSN